MTDSTKADIARVFALMPDDMRSPAATEDEIRIFEERYEPIPDDYRWFLKACGGGIVDAERLDSVHELYETHSKFREEFGPPQGWSMESVFVIGWDGAGNPFGICTRSGRVLVEDHNFGGIHEMAPSLQDLLVNGIVRNEALFRDLRDTPVAPQNPNLPEDCEGDGRQHQWYNRDGKTSGCYNCRTVADGELWRKSPRR